MYLALKKMYAFLYFAQKLIIIRHIEKVSDYDQYN